MPSITFYSLYDYNCGKLISKTFDLDEYGDYDEFSEARSLWLKELTAQIDDDNLREEYIVADTDEVPDRYVSEYSLDTEYFTYREVLNSLIDDYKHDAENILEAWIEYGYPLEKEQIQEAYIGHYKTAEDFGYNYLADNADLSSIPEYLASYINWERMAEDELINTYWESNGYTFYRI